MPTYTHGPYIAQALEGALMQKTHFDIEILIGEDGSADGTRKQCIEYAGKHPDIIRLFLNDRKNVIYIYGQGK
jgi:glycosyltransferase involved in cell wall biosynthesis